ncbi:MAG: hypothetical protein JRN34_01505 [Nitrososphaerota archaeon]|nr:hypothetical protein [Nitrososphaerota archaeon]MDG6941584.1 hypothetical protein [Nitrososphaerota archaeon]
MIALPLFRKKEVEILKDHVKRDSARPAYYDGGDADDWPNHPVWKSFQAQRKYAQIGLSILGLGIALQMASIYLQATLG